MKRKRVIYSDGQELILEITDPTESIDIHLGNKKVILEEDLSYLPDKDFINLRDNPSKYILRNKKVKKI